MAVLVVAMVSLSVLVWKRESGSKEQGQALLSVGLLLTATATALIGLRLIVWMEQSEKRMQSAEAWEQYWAQRVSAETTNQANQ